MDKYEIYTASMDGWHSYSIWELYPDGSAAGKCVHETGYKYLTQLKAHNAAELYIQNHLMPDKW